MTQPRIDSQKVVADLSAFAVDGVVPKRVVFPEDVDALAETMRLAHTQGLAVSPRGGGTKLALGNPPRILDLVVGTRELSGVVDHQPANMTVTVQAGTPLAALQAALAEQRQFLPLESPFPARATVGGVLATNASGPHRLAYGTVRDWLIGVRVVHADGTVTKAGGKVVKNVTGYDLNKLYVGSLGTLGVIVEATFKVAPLPVVRRTLSARFASVEGACRAALAVDTAGVGPLAAVVLNAEAARRSRADALPISSDEALLGVELGGRPRGVARRESDLRRILANYDVAEVEPLGNSEAFWQAVVDVGWEEAGRGTLALRFGVAPSAGERLIGTIRQVPIPFALIVHPGAGSMRAVVAGESDWSSSLEAVTLLVTSLRRAAAALDGYVVVERCDAPVKTKLDVWGDVGVSLGMMRRVKEQFDPSGVLNRGRFVGGI